MKVLKKSPESELADTWVSLGEALLGAMDAMDEIRGV
ncbi:hypothetical protein LCGC14_1119710 [marine sediment metagenome]|uniref:Uncharacterized protein n=1 Tax=marine sediment metagenome TaxID=412755 RepID=A0A0F9M4B7_9ZZZZ